MLALRLRWALRDARARWIQFTGIALMIAVGVGMSAALTSITEWRRASIDAGLESTNMFDIRARVSGDGVVPLETAQQIAGRPGMVNDLALSLAPGADPTKVEEMVRAKAAEIHPGAHLELSRPEDDSSYIALVETPELEHQIFVVFAVLLFAGAALATLNFASRMVEAQRREIGGAMALGQSPGRSSPGWAWPC